MKITPWGLVARFINLFYSVKPHHWVFGADYGNMYREGSKYLLEYMLREHPEYKCTFITKNKNVYNTLKNNGIPCEMNLSIRGICTIARAECIFTTQTTSDLHFAYKKEGRKFYYLVHGMPLKIAQRALSQMQIWHKWHKKRNILLKVKDKLSGYLNAGYTMDDVSFVSSTSDFLVPYMQKDFGESMRVKVLGMPRNDALFQSERMAKERWINGLEGKLVITYMPTHRAYGLGEVTPTPFVKRPDVQAWMKENNVVLLMKNHPNMIPKLKDVKDMEVIKDITKLRLDPQVCLYHSDAIITDFSSVWMDYLLLERPILFYIYDDFEHADVGTHYDIRQDPPGHFCYTEDELFGLIKKIRFSYGEMKPSKRIVHKYHKYIDGKSCERYFDEINKDLNNLR